MQPKWHRHTSSQALQASPPSAPYRSNRRLVVATVDHVGLLLILFCRLPLQVAICFGHLSTTLELVADTSKGCISLMADS